jgi:hypothetical protein
MLEGTTPETAGTSAGNAAVMPQPAFPAYGTTPR